MPEELKTHYEKLILTDRINNDEYIFVKAADKISAYLKCIEELNSGNKEFEKAKITLEDQIKKFKLQAVNYFMEVFIPSFYLSLDELN